MDPALSAFFRSFIVAGSGGPAKPKRIQTDPISGPNGLCAPADESVSVRMKAGQTFQAADTRLANMDLTDRLNFQPMWKLDNMCDRQ